jgi:hypothetical protein
MHPRQNLWRALGDSLAQPLLFVTSIIGYILLVLTGLLLTWAALGSRFTERP